MTPDGFRRFLLIFLPPFTWYIFGVHVAVIGLIIAVVFWTVRQIQERK